MILENNDSAYTYRLPEIEAIFFTGIENQPNTTLNIHLYDGDPLKIPAADINSLNYNADTINSVFELMVTMKDEFVRTIPLSKIQSISFDP